MGIFAFIVVALYGWLGFKLNKNPLLWMLIGLGTVMAIPLICSPFLLIFKLNPANALIFWTSVQLVSFIFSLSIALLIASKRGLLSGTK